MWVACVLWLGEGCVRGRVFTCCFSWGHGSGVGEWGTHLPPLEGLHLWHMEAGHWPTTSDVIAVVVWGVCLSQGSWYVGWVGAYLPQLMAALAR